jgi:hypothetical protein
VIGSHTEATLLKSEERFFVQKIKYHRKVEKKREKKHSKKARVIGIAINQKEIRARRERECND